MTNNGPPACSPAHCYGSDNSDWRPPLTPSAVVVVAGVVVVVCVNKYQWIKLCASEWKLDENGIKYGYELFESAVISIFMPLTPNFAGFFIVYAPFIWLVLCRQHYPPWITTPTSETTETTTKTTTVAKWIWFDKDSLYTHCSQQEPQLEGCQRQQRSIGSSRCLPICIKYKNVLFLSLNSTLSFEKCCV